MPMHILKESDPPVLGLCWDDQSGPALPGEAIRMAVEGGATVGRGDVTFYRVAWEKSPGSGRFDPPEEISEEALYRLLDGDVR